MMTAPIEDIILAKLKGSLQNAEEEALFAEWYAQPEHAKHYHELQRLQAAIYAQGKASQIETEKAWKNFSKGKRTLPLRRQILRYAAVACILCCAGAAFYWLNRPQPLPGPSLAQNTTKQEAILMLSNGEQIPLNDSLRSTLIQEKGTLIQNDTSNTLVYVPSGDIREVVSNTLVVPRGGEYKLALADGSVIWLNSDSKLTFPVAFPGETREVELEGEAFFEIAKNDTKPFIVHTGRFDVRVTGTQFNVRTYADEPGSATLAEGSIQLEKDSEIYRLTPGQQAYLDEGNIKIKQVDPEEAIAWRYGTFSFKQTRLEDLLRELARWYDIDIFYLNPACKELHFTAWFQRSNSIHEVIGILEKTEKIKLELKGKTLTVQSK